jgi:hypothetical protein
MVTYAILMRRAVAQAAVRRAKSAARMTLVPTHVNFLPGTPTPAVRHVTTTMRAHTVTLIALVRRQESIQETFCTPAPNRVVRASAWMKRFTATPNTIARFGSRSRTRCVFCQDSCALNLTTPSALGAARNRMTQARLTRLQAKNAWNHDMLSDPGDTKPQVPQVGCE